MDYNFVFLIQDLCDFYFRSNCYPPVLEVMRHHYSRPHFLPDDAEHAHVDYIFMGYQQGAVMHVSYNYFGSYFTYFFYRPFNISKMVQNNDFKENIRFGLLVVFMFALKNLC